MLLCCFVIFCKSFLICILFVFLYFVHIYLLFVSLLFFPFSGYPFYLCVEDNGDALGSASQNKIVLSSE